MLQVTQPAGRLLSRMLSKYHAPDGVALRLYLQYNDLAIAVDEMYDDDATYDFEGRTVLVLDEQMCEMLDGARLEIEETEQGPQLAVL